MVVGGMGMGIARYMCSLLSGRHLHNGHAHTRGGIVLGIIESYLLWFYVFIYVSGFHVVKRPPIRFPIAGE